jgi:quercetin dioxygenase-like cupin family protein
MVEYGPPVHRPFEEGFMRQNFLVTLIILVLASLPFAKAQQNAPKTDGSPVHIMLAPDAIKWLPLPRDWADGPPPSAQAEAATGATEVAILQGDPTKQGEPFVIRLRSTAGTKLPPHFHLIDQNITVLSGVFCIGTGNRLDEIACKDMPDASYFVLPKGMHHFALAKGDVIQIHGIGPFKIYWVR